MATIEVKTVGDAFEVTVRDAGSATTHRVTAASDHFARLAPGTPAPLVIEAAFRFLLDRETKESILRRFDLRDISRYFPEFERELAAYLARGKA